MSMQHANLKQYAVLATPVATFLEDSRTVLDVSCCDSVAGSNEGA